MPLLREHPEDLRGLIGAAASAHALDQTFLEKDFLAALLAVTQGETNSLLSAPIW